MFARVSKAGGVLKIAFAAITGPVGIVVAAIAALIAIVLIVRKHMDVFKRSLTALSPVFGSIKGHLQSVAEKFRSLWGTAGPIVTKLAHILGIVLTAAVGGLVGFVSNSINTILSVMDGLMTALQGIIDFVTGVFTGDWELAWSGLSGIVSGVAESIVSVMKGAVNGLISAINGFLGGLNGIKIPDWVPGVGGKGFSIPLIPQLAKGTDNWKGGLAQVHERGGEIIDLPKGTRVYPHDESIRKARQEGSLSVQIAKLADQIVVREDADIDRIADALLRKIKSASGNMGGVSVAGMA